MESGRRKGYIVTAEAFQHPQWGRGHVIYGQAPACGLFATVTIFESVVQPPSTARPEDFTDSWRPCAAGAQLPARQADRDWRGGRYVPWRPAHGVWRSMEALLRR
jgi:hypothetical protein